MSHAIKIGTRKSALAMAQTRLVVDAIHKVDPRIVCEIIPLMTKGDYNLKCPLYAFGGKGEFVSEFENALKNRKIDLAVHSAKDMPMQLENGLLIAGTLKRGDAREVLIFPKEKKGQIKIVGTSSLRRKQQMNSRYEVVCKDIRGNIGTRLSKLDIGEYDAVLLAAAGISRLGLINEKKYSYQYFEPEDFIPAAGQAIIAIEGRKDDPCSILMKKITDASAFQCLETERQVLRLLNAGCHEPVGVYAKIEGEQIELNLLDRAGEKQQLTGLLKERFKLAENIVNNMRIEK